MRNIKFSKALTDAYGETFARVLLFDAGHAAGYLGFDAALELTSRSSRDMCVAKVFAPPK